MRLLPRSMSSLVALGFVIAAMPLAIALLMAISALDRVTQYSDSLLHDSILITRLGEQLRGDIRAMEISARDFVDYGNEAELRNFYEQLDQAIAVLRAIDVAGLDSAFGQEVVEVEQALTRARDAWTGALERGEALTTGLEVVGHAGVSAEEMLQAGTAALRIGEAELEDAVRNAQRTVLIVVGALIPLSVALFFGLTTLINRPVRRAREAIRELGRGRHDHPVRIRYPEEMSELGETLDWLRLRLANLEADKERFMRHVTHELKTPLATLKEGVQLLADGYLGAIPTEKRELVRILQEASEDLETLILRLLSYAEWRMERRQDKPGWQALEPLLEEASEASAVAVRARRLLIRREQQGEFIYGRRIALAELFDNLLTNAIKHAPEGSVIIVSACTRPADDDEEEGNTVCEITVRDHGPGVPDAEKERIFQPFARGSASIESAVRGTGLGLAIVAETVRELNGEVYVEDAEPGARFVLRWPARGLPPATLTPQSQEAPDGQNPAD